MTIVLPVYKQTKPCDKGRSKYFFPNNPNIHKLYQKNWIFQKISGMIVGKGGWRSWLARPAVLREGRGFKMHYFYILESQKNNLYYYGSTNNLQRRLREHNNSQIKFTRHKGPWNLIYFERYKTLTEARKREYQVKRKKRKNYVKWLIDNKKIRAVGAVG